MPADLTIRYVPYATNRLAARGPYDPRAAARGGRSLRRTRGRRGRRRPALLRRPRGRRAARVARVPGRRRRAGRPRGDLGAEHRTSGSSPRSGSSRAGGVLVPAQHALEGRRGGLRPAQESARGCSAPSATSSAPSYVAALTRARTCPTSERIVCLRGAAAGALDWRGLPRARRRRSPRPRRGARRCGRAGRPLRHPLHLGHHREAQGRDDQPRPEPARLRGLERAWSGCARATAT